MMQGIFVICLLLFCFWGVFRRIDSPPPDPEGTYSAEVSNQIRRIGYLNEQLQAVEELIIDIQLSNENHHKNVRLDWQTSYGKNLTADVWVDGNSQVTAQTLALAEERERELTASLFCEIDKLYAMRSKQYVRKTMINYRTGEDRNDV